MRNDEMNPMDDFAPQIDDNLIDSFVQEEEIDPNEEKLKEMNKKLPKWSLEPPQGFLK